MSGFFKGAAVAAILALAGAVTFAGLASLIGAPLALCLVIVALGGAYILYLLKRASDRTGRIAVFACTLDPAVFVHRAARAATSTTAARCHEHEHINATLRQRCTATQRCKPETHRRSSAT